MKSKKIPDFRNSHGLAVKQLQLDHVSSCSKDIPEENVHTC